MIYMLAQMIFGSLFTLCIKWVQTRRLEDMITVGMINYIVAALAVLPDYLATPTEGVDWPAAACGANMGITYFVAFFFAIYAVKTVGAASATVVSVLSIVVPIICAIFLWNIWPSSFQVVGVGMALASLLLISSSRVRSAKPATMTSQSVDVTPVPPSVTWKTPAVLLAFFLLCGNSRLAQETLKHVSDASGRPTFLVAAFIVAAIPSTVFLLVRRQRIKPLEVVFGVGLGLTNLMQSHFVLKALEGYPGFIVFPVTSAGALVVTTLLATWLLHERLTRRAYLGICLATLALVLLYWLPGDVSQENSRVFPGSPVPETRLILSKLE